MRPRPSRSISTPQIEPAAGRDPWFDNSRWLAGTLVVAVHAFGPILDASPEAGWLYLATWAIRVPLFAILVGYFSAAVPGPGDFTKLLRTVLIPLIAVSLIHAVGTLVIDGHFPSIAEPAYTLWFLYGVVLWRMTLPYLARFRWPLLIGLLLALAAGFTSALGDAFALSRVAGFLPFFLAGWWLRSNNEWLRVRTWKTSAIAAAVVLSIVTIASTLDALGLMNRMVYGMVTRYTSPIDALWRLLVIVAALAMALAVMHLMPRRHIPFITYIGQGGFYIYLLHGLVLRAVRPLGVLPEGPNPTVWDVALVIVFGVLLAAALGSPLVRKLARPLVQPRGTWLLQKP